MVFPNIYAGDYRWLVLFPVVVILLALLFIPRIPLGREFTGGLRITAFFSTEVPSLPVEGETRILSSPSGYSVEISAPRTPKMEEAERLRNAFEENLLAYREALARGDHPDLEAVLSPAREILRMAGRELASNLTLSEMEREVESAYSAVIASEVTRIEEEFKALPGFVSVSVEVIGPTLSQRFVGDAAKTVVFALFLSALGVFLYFGSPFPALAVITGALADEVFALGAMGFLGIPLSLHTLAALLMLLGFSLDTDILLTSRMLSSSDPRKAAASAMQTGLVMSGTTLLAFLVLTLAGWLTKIPVYYDMGLVASAGLIGDLIATWGLNAVMMIWFLEGKR